MHRKRGDRSQRVSTVSLPTPKSRQSATNPEIKAIGDKYGKSNAQIVLRWNAQRGVSIIPKSVKVERMEQNIDIWDFELTEEDMAAVAAKDLGHSEIVNHDDPQFVKFVLGLKIHE